MIQPKNTKDYRAMWSAKGEAAVRTVVATACMTSGAGTFGLGRRGIMGGGVDLGSIGGVRSRPARGALAANQREAYAAALGEGLSATAARALVANMSGESLANPRDYHWDRRHMSGGIVQWDPERSAVIKRQFGKLPWEMGVAEQRCARSTCCSSPSPAAAASAPSMPRVMMALPETVFMPVAVAPAKLVEELSTTAKIVMVSNETMNVKVGKQGGDRPVTPETFTQVQKLFDDGQMIDDGVPAHRVFGSSLWMGIVKATKTGRGLILSSFHGLNGRKWAAVLKRAAKRSRENTMAGGRDIPAQRTKVARVGSAKAKLEVPRRTVKSTRKWLQTSHIANFFGARYTGRPLHTSDRLSGGFRERLPWRDGVATSAIGSCRPAKRRSAQIPPQSAFSLERSANPG